MADPSQIPSSQDPLFTQVEYDQAILFNWTYTNQKPFVIYRKEFFKTNEIRNEWYTHKLSNSCRLRQLKPIERVPGPALSMFAKVQKSRL